MVPSLFLDRVPYKEALGEAAVKYYLHYYSIGKKGSEFKDEESLEREIKSLIRAGFHDQDLIVLDESGKHRFVRVKIELI